MAFELSEINPDLGADQPAQPARRDQVRRPPADGPLGGRQVGRDLPPDHPRRPLPPLRRPGREPRRPAAAGGQGGAQRGDDGQLPDHARRRARGRPGDVRGAGPERRAPARQRRQPAPRQPLRLARGRDAGDADRRADRPPGRSQLLGPLDPAAGGQEDEEASALPAERHDRHRGAAGGAPRPGAPPAAAPGRAARRGRGCCSTGARCCCSARTTTSASPTTRGCARRRPRRRCAGAPAPAPRG